MFGKLMNKMSEGLKEDFSEEMEFLQVEALQKFLPMVKKFAPKLEKGAKEFMAKNNCIAVIKMEKNGDLTCSILKKDFVEIVPVEGAPVTKSEDLFVKEEKSGQKMLYSLESLMELFTTGLLEKELNK